MRIPTYATVLAVLAMYAFFPQARAQEELIARVGKARELYVAPHGAPEGPGTRNAPYDLFTILGRKSPAQAGDLIWMLEGRYPIPANAQGVRVMESSLTGAPDRPVVLRALPGHKVHVDGALEVKGADAWYWGFEIGDSEFAALPGRGEAEAKLHPATINAFGPRTRFINLDVHDGAMGFGFWTPAVDAEIYGCLIHDFGYGGKDRGHGHAIYTQNAQGTKRIVDNIMWHGYGWNLHVYTQGGQVEGFHVEGNISFSAGTKAVEDPNAKDSMLLCAYKPLDRIALIGNICYDPRSAGWRPNVRMARFHKEQNLTGEVRDNYMAGLLGLQLHAWKKMTCSGNTIWAPARLLDMARDPNTDWTVDNNTYIALPATPGFNGKTFAEYRQATGFDANSTLMEAPRPAGAKVFVRPNKYEPGRAHVAVFNWDGLDRVAVDLSAVLKPGQKYEARNVQFLKDKPVASGVFDGKPLFLPMAKTAIAPDFDAFLVLPVP